MPRCGKKAKRQHPLSLHRLEGGDDSVLVDARVLHIAKVTQQRERAELALRKQTLPVLTLADEIATSGRQGNLPGVGSRRLAIDQPLPQRCLLGVVWLRV